jgi:hypothetical protein
VARAAQRARMRRGAEACADAHGVCHAFPSIRACAQEISDRVKGSVLEELIPLIDNFEAAKQYIKARARSALGARCVRSA